MAFARRQGALTARSAPKAERLSKDDMIARMKAAAEAKRLADEQG